MADPVAKGQSAKSNRQSSKRVLPRTGESQASFFLLTGLVLSLLSGRFFLTTKEK